MTSTPTIKGLSRIEKAYDESDKRVFQVPCPHCKELQELKWQQIVWHENKPETACLSCKHCGSVIEESKKQWMLQNGKWKATEPNGKKVGFHISELYSPFRTWVELVEDFLEAKKSPELLQTFLNTSLAETWEEQGEEIEAEGLMEKCENYNHESIPKDVLVLSAGIDTQNDRVEITVIGYSENMEAWVVEHRIIWGNPATKEIWMELDEYLKLSFDREDGARLPISIACIDSGGSFTDQVYAFTRGRNNRRIFAVKGASQSNKPIASRPTFVGRRRTALYSVGTDTAKEFIHARLKDEATDLIHFPNTVDEEYFKQLTAERRVSKFVRGKKSLVWKQTRQRNEALDCFVYSLAGIHILQPDFSKLVGKTEVKKQKNTNQKSSLLQERRRLYRRKERNFITSWKD